MKKEKNNVNFVVLFWLFQKILYICTVIVSPPYNLTWG